MSPARLLLYPLANKFRLFPRDHHYHTIAYPLTDSYPSSFMKLLRWLLVAISGRALGFVLATERSVQISLCYLSAELSILLPLAILGRRVKWRELGLLCAIVRTFGTTLA